MLNLVHSYMYSNTLTIILYPIISKMLELKG